MQQRVSERTSYKALERRERGKQGDGKEVNCHLRTLASERASNADRRDQSEATRVTGNRYLKSSLNADLW